MTPTDPLYPSQWHLPALGNIERVWDDYSGAGVRVVIYDRGVHYRHPDILPNYDAARHVAVRGQVLDGAVTWREERPGHGTIVAGMIASALDGKGTVGISWGATLTSVNVFDPLSPAYLAASDRSGFREALHQAAGFDVVYTLLRDGSVGVEAQAEYLHAVQTGRGGLGTIIAQPAGNSTEDNNGGLPSRFTISVAATTRSGDAEPTSAHGAGVLVAAPGEGRSIVSTALPPRTQPELAAYTTTFGWTSSASAVVAGIVPLILEANPRLGWRDVFDILAMTARVTGSGIGGAPRPDENDAWLVNAAAHWNGGGMHFSRDFGFGIPDVLAAVRLAESYAVMGIGPGTLASEARVASARQSSGLAVPDLGQASFTLRIGQDIRIEQVELLLWLGNGPRSDLGITLTSPGGTTVTLLDAGVLGSLAHGVLRLGAEAFRGEGAAGDWTVTIADRIAGGAASITGLQIEAFGRAGPDDVHALTDEFAEMLALDARRGLLSDTDGGTDWLNAAAVSTASTLHLAPGRFLLVDGARFQIAPGTVIENAVGGDGDDRIIGNGAGNRLHGMRGADTIGGLAGDDYLAGGTGRDRLQGGDGADTLRGGTGADRLAGEAGPDLFLFGRGDTGRGPGRDIVVDFEQGLDRLGFLGPPFTVIGRAAFTGTPNELRHPYAGANTLVQLDLNGDAVTDREIILLGRHALTASDFVFLPV